MDTVQEYFDLESIEDDAICSFLLHCINDDDAYEEFMMKLRAYKSYTGFAGPYKRLMAGFLFHLTSFSKQPQETRERLWIVHIFKSTFVELERMRSTSTIKRNFTDDFVTLLK
jgi:hypothetical protein